MAMAIEKVEKFEGSQYLNELKSTCKNYTMYGIHGGERVFFLHDEKELHFISAQNKVLSKIEFVDTYKNAEKSFNKCCKCFNVINENRKIISAIENSNIATELKPQISEKFYNNVAKEYMAIERIFSL